MARRKTTNIKRRYPPWRVPILRWVDALPNDVPANVRRYLFVFLSRTAKCYALLDRTAFAAQKERARIWRVVAKWKADRVDARAIEVLLDTCLELSLWAGQPGSPTRETRAWGVTYAGFDLVRIADSAFIAVRLALLGIAERMPVEYVSLTNEMELLSLALKGADIPTAEHVKLAIEGVRLIGHKKAYRPPREGMWFSSRAHQGRRRAEPKPDPLARYLDYVRAVWPKVLRVREAGFPAEATDLAMLICKDFSSVPVGMLADRIYDGRVKERSLARLLGAHSGGAPTRRKKPQGNIA